MLKRLLIENFALVKNLEIAFEPGMNVLTGETGAGKSVIVGAIALVLGEKADRDDIRSGSKLAIIEANFDIVKQKKIIALLKQHDILNDNKIITIRREIFPSRASKCFINGQLITQTQLKTITVHLAELFGQHSHQMLLDEKNHLGFLDQFAGLENSVDKLRALYSNWKNTGDTLRFFISQKDRKIRERELMVFQKDEIEKANIVVGEEENLINEKRILDSSRLLSEKSTILLGILDNPDNSITGALGTCQKELSLMVERDRSLETKQELLNNAVISIEEFRSEIEAYQSSIPDDPNRLEEINQRLDEIYRLKKKYGGSEETILESLEKINTELEATYDIDSRIEHLKKEEKKLGEEYSQKAIIISEKRVKAAGKLSKSIKKELATLSMQSAEFEFDFAYIEIPDGIKLDDHFVAPGPDGLESGRFMISANPGEPPKPLAKIASGGEVSRIMLALKAVGMKKYSCNESLLVFDEIDAGIGGTTALAVADRLAVLSKNYQLLVITHLHQIALKGNSHFAVEKDSKTNRGRNIITLRKLKDSDKTKEIERMLALPENITS